MDINLVMIEPTDDGLLEDLAKKSIRHGEEALMLAVLKSATQDFQDYVNARDRKARLLFSQAEEWFLDETSDSLFSFENICDVLRLKSNYFRKGLFQWKETFADGSNVTRHRVSQRSPSLPKHSGRTGQSRERNIRRKLLTLTRLR